MKKGRNFALFFALFNQMQGADDELKCELVGTYTGGRTTSLRDMTTQEYRRMCEAMQASLNGLSDEEFKRLLKAKRSAVLKRMQQMGIDTTSWSNVDNFCLNPRIAGKVFRHLGIEELEAMIPKLAAIGRKDTKKKLATMPKYMLN